MDWPFLCTALSLIVWKGHVKGDWEKVRCLQHSGVHIFHQTVVHSPRLLSCYLATFRYEGEILFQIIVGKQLSYSDSSEANVLIDSVWNIPYFSRNWNNSNSQSVVNVDQETHFAKWDLFMWNHVKSWEALKKQPESNWHFPDWFPLTQQYFLNVWIKRNRQRNLNILSLDLSFCFHHERPVITLKAC